MATKVPLICHYCKAELIVEFQPWTTRLDLRVRGGKLRGFRSGVEFLCGNCGSTIGGFDFEKR
jgi:hypothetical protein